MGKDVHEHLGLTDDVVFVATRSEHGLPGSWPCTHTTQRKTERARHPHAPLPWTLTTFIASELGTCSKFCWWKLVDRAWDSSVLESCSCWTGANGGCWLYVSVTVKPETNHKMWAWQKILQSHQKKGPKSWFYKRRFLPSELESGLAFVSWLSERLLTALPAGLTHQPSTCGHPTVPT